MMSCLGLSLHVFYTGVLQRIHLEVSQSGTRHRQQENVQSMDERVAVGGVEGVGVVEIGGTITR